MYCVKCKKVTDTSNVEFTVSKDRRNMKRGKYVISGTTKTQFIKAHKSLLNKAINNLPFEMHLPGHNFTGPRTKLKKRLNLDLTPQKSLIHHFVINNQIRGYHSYPYTYP